MSCENTKDAQNPEKGGSFIKKSVLRFAILPFTISILSIIAFIIVYISQIYHGINVNSLINEKYSPFSVFMIANSTYIILSSVAIFGCYIGYRLAAAAGATRVPVIPPEDYALLAPLVQAGKAGPIGLYIRLSSLSRFTGTFTQLGLTGLPVATIFLTLFFSFMALTGSPDFIDLAKLTLGAFIGSFVQRQIERRAGPDNQAETDELSESKSPRDSA